MGMGQGLLKRFIDDEDETPAYDPDTFRGFTFLLERSLNSIIIRSGVSSSSQFLDAHYPSGIQERNVDEALVMLKVKIMQFLKDGEKYRGG